MTFWILFMVVAFAVGGTRLGRWGRRHQIVVIVATTLAAASFYSLRIAT